MSQFPRVAVGAAVNLPVDDDSRADTRADVVIDQVAATPARAERQFTQRACVGIVIHNCRYAEDPLNGLGNGHAVPTRHVCGIDDPLGCEIHGAAETDSTSGHGFGG